MSTEERIEAIPAAPPAALLDLTSPMKVENLASKTIVITGGARGLGEGMFRFFARHGANVIIGDLASSRGEALVQEVRKETGNNNHYFVPCNVTSWAAQCAFFTSAVALSPTGTLNTVVANAGVGEPNPFIDAQYDASQDPPEPDLTPLEVNLRGLVYTSKLAYHHFLRGAPDADKHLLLVGSLASFGASNGVLALYTASKHAVLGFFRCLRMWPGHRAKAVRINIIAPYYVATPLLDTTARVMLAGLELATVENVVEAAARLTCDPAARGRCLAVAPKGSGGIVEVDVESARSIEAFAQRITTALSAAGYLETALRAAVDLPKALGFPVTVGIVGFVVAAVWLILFR